MIQITNGFHADKQDLTFVESTDSAAAVPKCKVHTFGTEWGGGESFLLWTGQGQ